MRGKTFTFILLFGFTIGTMLSGTVMADDVMQYVGSKSCKKCHRKTYKSWKQTAMADAFEILRAGNRVEAKKRAELDPQKDYSTDTNCLPCHTTGYGQFGGFTSEGDSPKLVGVGCESCHGIGSSYNKIMGRRGRHYDLREVLEAGLNAYPTSSCVSCHNSSSPTWDSSFDAEDGKWSSHDPIKLKYHEYAPEEKKAIVKEFGMKK